MSTADGKIRVGMFFNHASIIGGGELSFIDLIDQLRNHTIVPVAFVPGQGEISDELHKRDIPVNCYPSPPIRFYTFPIVLFTLLKLTLFLHRYRLSIVHTNGARCMLYAGVAAAFNKIPVIWHIRVLERDAVLDRFRAMLATKIISISAAVAQTMHPISKAQSKIRIIYNGINTQPLLEAPPSNLQQDLLLPALPVILAVGRLCEVKRFHILIEACKLLKDNCPPFTCLIIGQDAAAEKSYCKNLRSLPALYKLDNIIFGGWRLDIPSIMKSSTLLVVPSASEGFGRIIVEAWACGLPVIATDVGGPGEIIQPGVNGLLVPVDSPEALAEKIKTALTDTTLQEGLREKGFTSVKEYTLDEHRNKIVSLYREIVEK
jgi:glycosyltransferase involved in cell wall biosynthesis